LKRGKLSRHFCESNLKGRALFPLDKTQETAVRKRNKHEDGGTGEILGRAKQG